MEPVQLETYIYDIKEVFKKKGEKYEKRYLTYFKNPDIRRHDMQHEELFCSHVEKWVEGVRKSCGMEWAGV